MTLEDKLAKSDPEFLEFLKDEGSAEMLGWAADDLSASSTDESDDDQHSPTKVKLLPKAQYFLSVLSFRVLC